MNLGNAQIIQGNALDLPLPDSSVDAVITSPPYFGLRSYQDGGVHYDGQIGSEATPAEFLDALIAATREMVRVLKPTGSIFVNLGDKYVSHPARAEAKSRAETMQPTSTANLTDFRRGYGLRDKSLMGIPWRYAIRCIDDLGLILRAEIIWNKPNGLPESVTDRVRRSHEQWFHMTIQPRYFAAVDEIRENYSPNQPWGNRTKGKSMNGGAASGTATTIVQEQNELGKLPGSVWTIPTQPLTVPPELGVDHFAAYPMEWPRRIIQGWTPNGVCVECGEGRRPIAIVESEILRSGEYPTRTQKGRALAGGEDFMKLSRKRSAATITGYTCACDSDGYRTSQHIAEMDDHVGHFVTHQTQCLPLPPTTPAIVLDPFGGTGTTALVAKAFGRTGISIDLSADYCRLAEWRCNDQRELAAALQVEKPEAVHPDQMDLFSEAP